MIKLLNSLKESTTQIVKAICEYVEFQPIDWETILSIIYNPQNLFNCRFLVKSKI